MQATLPDLAARLAFLRAHCATREARETHMSWVLLGDETVLKLKKPVRSEVLDFSTVQAREADAREEIRLNRRLAPDVYLGLIALTWDGSALRLVPQAQADRACTVDWLVLMRRLPADRMLDRLIADGQVTPAQVDALADRLVGFYRACARPALSPGEHLARLRRELPQNRRVLADARFGLAEAGGVLDALEAALDRHEPALAARVREGRVVEGHGDLRPEHVCLVDPPVVIDALEFNAGLRCVDPFDELAYLGLECDVAGAPWIAARLLARSAAALQDPPPPALLALWRAYRAVLRARLALAHLLDPSPRQPEKWLPLARRYLVCADAALAGGGAA